MGLDRLVLDLVLPAYAGMIPASDAELAQAERAPRVCGDDPTTRRKDSSGKGCSPRMRG